MPEFVRKSSLDKIASFEAKNAEIDKEALFRKKELLEQIADNIVKKLRSEKRIPVGLKTTDIQRDGEDYLSCEISFSGVYDPQRPSSGDGLKLRMTQKNKRDVLIELDYNRNFYDDVKVPLPSSTPLLMLENNWNGLVHILAGIVEDFTEIEEDKLVTFEQVR